MKRFDNFSSAFSYCREADKPVIVEVGEEGKFKLYPSGKAEAVGKKGHGGQAVKKGG